MGEINLIKDRKDLSENKASEIENLYKPMVSKLKDLEGRFNEIVKKEINNETMKEARELRLEIRTIRVNADKARKKAKENIIIEGRAIQSAYNTFVYGTKTKEDKLMDIEKHQEKMEQIRISNLYDERENDLKKYTDNIPPNLGEFTEEVWNEYYQGIVAKDKIQKQEAEAERKKEEEAEKKRKVIRERKELLIPVWQYIPEELKTADLSKISDQDFVKHQEEAKAKRQEEEKKQKAIQEENEKLKKEREVKAKKQAEKDEKERQEKKKLQDQLKEKEKLEADQKRKKEEDAEKELMKGDEDKVLDMIKDFEAIKTKYTFRSQGNQKIYSDVKTLIDRTINHIKTKQ